MLKITWDTYSYRRHLVKYGCKFSYEDKCRLTHHNEEIIDFCILTWLWFENFEADFNLDEEWEVKQKNIRAKQKAEKYQERALNYEKKWDGEQLGQHERDFLVLAEPIKIWHHSEWRHRKLLERSRRKMDKQMEYYKQSDELERKARYWENKKYTTEEEKEKKKEQTKNHWQRALDLWKSRYKIWDMYIWRHCSWIIEKINNKSVIIKWNNSWQSLKMDIAYSKDFDLLLKETQKCD